MYSTMQEKIGVIVLVAFEKVGVPCRIINARQVWGRVDYEVEPVGGKYTQWVAEGRLMN